MLLPTPNGARFIFNFSIRIFITVAKKLNAKWLKSDLNIHSRHDCPSKISVLTLVPKMKLKVLIGRQSN
jgi:hypothetical protein